MTQPPSLDKTSGRCVGRILLGVTTLAITLVAASPASAQPTRDQYIAQADPICAATNLAEARALRGVLSDARHLRLKRAAHKFRRSAALFRGGIEQIAVLEPPPADGALIADWIESLRAQPPMINRFARALGHAKFGRALRLANRLDESSSRSRALVEAYGFQACNML